MFTKKIVVAVLMLCMLIQPISAHAASQGVFDEAFSAISRVLEKIQGLLTFTSVTDEFSTVAATGISSIATSSYSLVTSTFLDGLKLQTKPGGMTRDVAFDEVGNMYVTGGTTATDFPTTIGAYDRTYATGGTSTGRLGTMDVFVMKFSPTGELLWSTLLGGKNYDRTYAIEIGPSGEVVVAGRAGEGFPTTSGVLQTAFLNNSADAARWNREYGRQNGFVTKFDTDGNLQWSSYFSGGVIRDIDIDTEGNIHLVPTESPASLAFPFVTANAFQAVLKGTNDGMYAKISPDGQTLLYGTYIGGSGKDGMHPSVRTTASGDVYYSTWSLSTDFPLKNAFQTKMNGKGDAVIAKFAKDGSLLFSSYYGGNEIEQMETHSLTLDGQDNAYLSGSTLSTNLNIQGGSDTTFSGPGDMFVIKVSPTGQLLASTYLGGNGLDRMEGTEFNQLTNELVVTGNTRSTDVATPDAFNTTLSGIQDGVLYKLSSDLSSVTYATYFGGVGSDEIRAVDINKTTGDILFGGMAASANMSVVNAFDSNLNSSVAPFISLFKNISITPPPPDDVDMDSIPDANDNCPVNANTNQENYDGDAVGNVCDADDDNDGINDVSEVEGCVFNSSVTCGSVVTAPVSSPVVSTPTRTPTPITGQAPTLLFSVASSTVMIGDKGSLSWKATNANTCVASGNWKGEKSTVGTFMTVKRSAIGTDTFTLTCTNAFGNITRSVSLTALSK